MRCRDLWVSILVVLFIFLSINSNFAIAKFVRRTDRLNPTCPRVLFCEAKQQRVRFNLAISGNPKQISNANFGINTLRPPLLSSDSYNGKQKIFRAIKRLSSDIVEMISSSAL